MRRAVVVVVALAVSLAAVFVKAQEGVGFQHFKAVLQNRPPAELEEDTVRTVRNAIRTILDPQWDVVMEGGELRIVPGPAPRPRSVAAAWATLHRLHSTGLFASLEPVYATAPPPQPGRPANPQWHGECRPPWSGSPSPSDDGALDDSTWHLGPNGANVFEAWTSATGLGRDVAIGHPDTGYLHHPSVTPALLGRGFDFTQSRSDALDTADDGTLQWPGHGTRTGSVIAGRQFELTSHWISGVAPAASLMPLKVAHRVVLLDFIEPDMTQLARAIRAAAIGDPNFVNRRADIISISLGGLPNAAVEAALAIAEANNVIVLAAAGNQVREVVFPARYPNVIAVAASNFAGSAWPGSSKGKAVAFAAPGQNVWTAKYRQIGDDVHHCIEPSSGTSYAVATAAGVAALWLSHHQKALADRRDIDRARTFKALAACTARPMTGVPDPQDYGAGIIDAARLLKESLPELDGPGLSHDPKCRAALMNVPQRPHSR